MRRIIKVRYDEQAFERVTFDGKKVSELPRFEKRRFARRMFFTEERVMLNLLLRTFSSLGLNVESIRRQRGSNEFKVRFADDRSITARVVNLRSPDQDVTDRISDISAGLSERISDDSQFKRILGRRHLSIIIPFIAADADDAQVMEEILAFITNESLGKFESETLKLTKVDKKYPTLEGVGARIFCRRSEFGSIQVTRGAMSVSSPFRIQDEIAATVRSGINNTSGLAGRENWLIVWFVSFYEHFPIDENFARQFDHFGIEPFARLLISNGSEILDRLDDPSLAKVK